jgi:hypothetical protein
MPKQKPPLGVMPERYWKEYRLRDLKRAISEYTTALLDIPEEWVSEYNRLRNELELDEVE